MKHKRFKRAVARLLVLTILGGALCPTIVYAEPEEGNIVVETTSSDGWVAGALTGDSASFNYLSYFRNASGNSTEPSAEVLETFPNNYPVIEIRNNGHTAYMPNLYPGYVYKGVTDGSDPIKVDEELVKIGYSTKIGTTDETYKLDRQWGYLGATSGVTTTGSPYANKVLSKLNPDFGTISSEDVAELCLTYGAEGGSIEAGMPSIAQRMAVHLWYYVGVQDVSASNVGSYSLDGDSLKAAIEKTLASLNGVRDNDAQRLWDKFKSTSVIDSQSNEVTKTTHKAIFDGTSVYSLEAAGVLALNPKVYETSVEHRDEPDYYLHVNNPTWRLQEKKNDDVVQYWIVDISDIVPSKYNMSFRITPKVEEDATDVVEGGAVRSIWQILFGGYIEDTSADNVESDSLPMYFKNYACAWYCLDELASWYLNDFKKILALENPSDMSQTQRAQLVYVRTMWEAFGDMIPFVDYVYRAKITQSGFGRSVEEVIAEQGLYGMTLKEALRIDVGDFTSHRSDGTPLSWFYTINSSVGITSYDRDLILNSMQVGNGLSDLYTEAGGALSMTTFLPEAQKYASAMDKAIKDYSIDRNTKYAKVDNSGEVSVRDVAADIFAGRFTYANNLVGWADTGTDYKCDSYANAKLVFSAILEELKKNHGGVYDYVACLDNPSRIVSEMYKAKSILNTVVTSPFNQSELGARLIEYMETKYAEDEDMRGLTLMDPGVLQTGNATTVEAVTMSNYITEGMGLSSFYIPMQSSIVDQQVLKRMRNLSTDFGLEFSEFFMKYGFMRKALLIDTSKTAGLDFYNSSGTASSNVRTAKLKDLIDIGDNEVVLYVDGNFYNYDQAVVDASVDLSEHTADMIGTQAILEAQKEIFKVLEETDEGKKTSFWSNIVSVLTASMVMLNPAVVGAAATVYPVVKYADAGNIFSVTKTADENMKAGNDYLSERVDVNGKYFTDNEARLDAKLEQLSQSLSVQSRLDKSILKHETETSYDTNLIVSLSRLSDAGYVNLGEPKTFKLYNDDGTLKANLNTHNNTDSLVLDSVGINKYLCGKNIYTQATQEGEATTTLTYETDLNYTPMMSYAYVSLLYRSTNAIQLANTVANCNPVFIASDKLCQVDGAELWYKNSLLNYALCRNLKDSIQIDLSYVSDLYMPIYIDIFGNIVTYSGKVVIPAACNATLHTDEYKDHLFNMGLYSVYGKGYSVPTSLKGADEVMLPFFQPDDRTGVYVITGNYIQVNGTSVRFNKLNSYNNVTRTAIYTAYMDSIVSGDTTKLNWMAMVNIVNEVMRGAPLEYINSEAEGISMTGTESALVAGAKFESLLNSMETNNDSTLLSIPNFSDMENLSVWIALFMKLLMVATAAVILVSIYRDGMARTLGWRTIAGSLSAIALTVLAVTGIPTVFNLTYYAANKYLLEPEITRLLIINEEKRQLGTEIGIMENPSYDSNGDFTIQLDWISVPWYKELENILYGSSLTAVQEVQQDAIREATALYDTDGIDIHNDGVYITTASLFDSVGVDMKFSVGSVANAGELITYTNGNTSQAASFYTPYYAFLSALTADVNEYNRWRNATLGEAGYTTEKDALLAMDPEGEGKLNSYSYTMKTVSGNRQKPAGLVENYFNSNDFMEISEDILHLREIYGATMEEYEAENSTVSVVQLNVMSRFENELRERIFTEEDRNAFKASLWYNNNTFKSSRSFEEAMAKYIDEQRANDPDANVVRDMAREHDAELQRSERDFNLKVEKMDAYCRDFIARNRDLIGKVTDETFLKVMALAMAVKYNQLFGIPSASGIEIYNLRSEDVLRLATQSTDDVIQMAVLSYPRSVMTSGGEPAVYLAAILSMIMWVGSFVKPICTVIVFISVFMSIYVFRVVLRRDSANLLGYAITVGLLCLTNFAHALLLKLCLALPNFGLSTFACLVVILLSQIAYMLLLGYVTGISLKDWYNLGATEYEKEARVMRHKFHMENAEDRLSGNVPHYDNNWDYYNSLVDQHKLRNVGTVATAGDVSMNLPVPRTPREPRFGGRRQQPPMMDIRSGAPTNYSPIQMPGIDPRSSRTPSPSRRDQQRREAERARRYTRR